MLESKEWRDDRIYDPEILIGMGIPRLPAPGETVTFETKEVE